MLCHCRLPNEKRLQLLLLVLVALQLSVPLHAQRTESVEELTRRATLIFHGTVEKTAASTMPAVKATDATAIVRVDRVINSPSAPPGLAGKQITVQLLNPGAVKPGSQAVFFTKGWLLGRSMAVTEVGQLPSTVGVQGLSEQIASARQKISDEELQNQLATAEAVVVGRVAGIRPAEIPHLGSEHDPDWYVAVIKVESVLKGEPGREISLLFPHSDDVAWHNAPKFKEGQQGIWLLHRNQARLPGIENQLTALRPLDFHSREELSRVERLVKAVR
jgi:hypothetical protein